MGEGACVQVKCNISIQMQPVGLQQTGWSTSLDSSQLLPWFLWGNNPFAKYYDYVILIIQMVCKENAEACKPAMFSQLL